MKRRYMGNQEDREKIKVLLKQSNPSWLTTRLIVLKMGFNPDNSGEKISDETGVSIPTINRWFSTYRKQGLNAVLVRDYSEVGRPTRKDSEVVTFLENGLKVARWNTAKQATEDLEKHFDQKFKYKTVWNWLKKCAGVLRIPRPVHEKRDPQKAEDFKRSFLGKLKALPIDRKKAVKIWFADESRYGLLPNLRRVWTQKALRPHKPWQSKFEWSYCYGALDVVEGKAIFLQTPSVNLQWSEAFLKEIIKSYPEHEHVVVWDGAGFHPQTSDHECVPERIHLITLPPYSPELNPIEKLWDCIQDYTANKLWPTIERLDEVVASLLKDWWEDSSKVLGLIGKNYHQASANDSYAS